MNAYDYANHVWVSGIDGARLAFKQAQEEYDALADPKYASFIGCPDADAARAELVRTMDAAYDEMERAG